MFTYYELQLNMTFWSWCDWHILKFAIFIASLILNTTNASWLFLFNRSDRASICNLFSGLFSAFVLFAFICRAILFRTIQKCWSPNLAVFCWPEQSSSCWKSVYLKFYSLPYSFPLFPFKHFLFWNPLLLFLLGQLLWIWKYYIWFTVHLNVE